MNIKLFVMDVDGTLTDGHIYFGENGEVMKAFHVRDGYAIAHILPKFGVTSVIITGRESEIVRKRATELKIAEVHQGVSDKLSKLKEIAEKYNVEPHEVAYIGDDVNDLDCIKWCGVTACPSDAADEVREAVEYVCQHEGGEGAVREFADFLIKNKATEQ